MTQRETECPFCNLESKRIVAENEYAIAFRDGFPVTDLHTLVIPRRHISDYFVLNLEERAAIDELLTSLRDEIQRRDGNVEGFNIGWNCGEVAGQTIFHAHVHLIPRRRGDVEDSRGGVRHLIPGKGSY